MGVIDAWVADSRGDGRASLQVVSEGGSGCFFDDVAEEVAIVREGEALDIARRSAA